MKHPTMYRLSMATAMGMTLSLLGMGDANAYTFSRIFDDSGPYNSIGNSAINNQGTVAFTARLDIDQLPLANYYYHPNYQREVIFIGDGASLTPITPNRGEFQIKDINDSNTVAFVAKFGSPHFPQCPLKERLNNLRQKYSDDPQANQDIDNELQEIEIYQKYSDRYGYVFYIIQVQ